MVLGGEQWECPPPREVGGANNPASWSSYYQSLPKAHGQKLGLTVLKIYELSFQTWEFYGKSEAAQGDKVGLAQGRVSEPSKGEEGETGDCYI